VLCTGINLKKIAASFSGGATGRTGEDTSPPVLFKVNFLICSNPVRKMGGGGRL
jgi:hypothetical protein